MRGQTHGFDQFGTRGKGFERERLVQRDLLYERLADWLDGVFTTSSSSR